MSYDIKPLHALTRAELIAQGAAAADRSEGIYEASIRAGLSSDALLIFEQGYFERRFELDAKVTGSPDLSRLPRGLPGSASAGPKKGDQR